MKSAIVAAAIAAASAQVTLNAPSQGTFSAYSAPQTYNFQGTSQLGAYQGTQLGASSQLGSYSFGQGATQVGAQTGQFRVPSQQTSLPAGFQVSSQYTPTQYTPSTTTSQQRSISYQPYSTGTTTQQFTMPSQQSTVPNYGQQVRSAPLGTTSLGATSGYTGYNTGASNVATGSTSIGGLQLPPGYSVPAGFQLPPGFSFGTGTGASTSTSTSTGYPQGYPQGVTGYPQGYSQGVSGYPQGYPQGAATTGSSQGGFRTMYVPLNQVQSVLSQNPGAKVVGQVPENQIPAGANTM